MKFRVFLDCSDKVDWFITRIFVDIEMPFIPTVNSWLILKPEHYQTLRKNILQSKFLSKLNLFDESNDDSSEDSFCIVQDVRFDLNVEYITIVLGGWNHIPYWFKEWAHSNGTWPGDSYGIPNRHPRR